MQKSWRFLAVLMAFVVMISTLMAGCNGKNPAKIENNNLPNDIDYPIVIFGEKTISNGITYTLDSKAKINTGSATGKEYIKIEPDMKLNFKLDDNFAKKLSGKNIFIKFEYYESSSKNFSVSYEDNDGKKTDVITMSSSSKWGGSEIKVKAVKFDPDSKAHFTLKLDTANSMWLRSVSIVENTTKEQTYPQIIKTDYETSNGKVIEANVKDYGAIGDGKTDDSIAFHTALRDMKEKGGVLYVPAGTYKLTHDLDVPTGVTVLGDFNKPSIDNPKAGGTIIAAYVATIADGNNSMFMSMNPSSCVKGLTIWYPEQTLESGEAEPYNYTLGITGGVGVSIEDIYLVNSYYGITHDSYDRGHQHQMLKNIYGTPLKLGHLTGYANDSDRHQGFYFSPEFWLGSGLSNIPDENVLRTWLINYAVGLKIGRIDFHYVSDIAIDGYKIGLHMTDFYGRVYNANITNCNVCMYVEKTSGYGAELTKAVFKADGGKDPVALLVGENAGSGFSGTMLDISSTGKYAISHLSSGAMSITDSKITVNGKDSVSPLYVVNGRVSIMNTEFDGGENHAVFLSSADKSGIFNCTASSGELKIENNTENMLTVETLEGNVGPLASDVLNTADEKRAYQSRGPAKLELYNIADYDIPDGEEPEISEALQKAIDAAAESGGGLVYIPAGVYRLESPVTVKSGVEVAGISDFFHFANSSIISSSILTEYGKGSAKEPLIKLEENSGVRGLSIFYDKITQETVQKHTPTIQATGKDCYTVNTLIVGAWDAIDFNTYKCDNSYIDSIYFFAFNKGIAVGGGSTGGVLLNCHSNPGAMWSTGFNKNEWSQDWSGPLISGQHERSVHFYFGDCTDQIAFMNATFGANKGVMIDGADIVMIGLGVDYSVNNIYITGDSNATIFDPQCIGSDSSEPYASTPIICDKNFKGTANVYNICAWNIHDAVIRVDGGTFSINGGYCMDTGRSPLIATGGIVTMRGVIVKTRSVGDLQALSGTKSVTAYGNIIYGTPNFLVDSSVKTYGSDIK